MSWKWQKRYPEDLVKVEKQGVKVYETPKSVLQAQLAAWDKILPRLSQENKFFGKVVDSQKAWAKTVRHATARSSNRRVSSRLTISSESTRPAESHRGQTFASSGLGVTQCGGRLTGEGLFVAAVLNAR